MPKLYEYFGLFVLFYSNEHEPIHVHGLDPDGRESKAEIIVKDGKIVKAKGYGLANLELNVPATADSVFPIASITKPFTALAIMMLVEEGKIEEARKNVSIIGYTTDGTEIVRWTLEAAWCSKLTGPVFDAKSNEIGIEDITIVFESYKREK